MLLKNTGSDRNCVSYSSGKRLTVTVTADSSDGVLALDLIREGHGKQFSMRKYAF